jgi:hypothetical protein
LSNDEEKNLSTAKQTTDKDWARSLCPVDLESVLLDQGPIDGSPARKLGWDMAPLFNEVCSMMGGPVRERYDLSASGNAPKTRCTDLRK